MDRPRDRDFQKAIASTRWALPVPLWVVIIVLGWGTAAQSASTPWALLVAAVYALQAVGATILAVRLLGAGAPPRGAAALRTAITALSAIGLVLALAAAAQEWLTGLNAATACALAVLPAAVVWAEASWRITGTLALASSLAAGLHPAPVVAVASTAGAWAFGVVLVRLYGWSIAVMHRLEGAKETEARLAVAEERLRFARDLHDTLGRTMAVIALKGELASRITQDSRIVAEMNEVQRLARSSGEEIRDVVRGYQRADLATELDGARSVLTAAGINCRIHDEGRLDLSEEELSTLGWVVREGATNVIRHSNATFCTFSITEEGGDVVLRIVNNGAPSPLDNGHDARTRGSGTGTGTGMPGLEQRLRASGGTLVHSRQADGTYHLNARIPQGQERR